MNQNEEVLLLTTSISTKLSESYEEEDFGDSSDLGCCPWKSYLKKRRPYINAMIQCNIFSVYYDLIMYLIKFTPSCVEAFICKQTVVCFF